jgi:hypothetical protein
MAIKLVNSFTRLLVYLENMVYSTLLDLFEALSPCS